ncbi:AAA domain-containing protein 2 [Elsinoe fawcettii]|nr:AAA domain-containing protein 2 [Elsinoe fawcettii]
MSHCYRGLLSIEKLPAEQPGRPSVSAWKSYAASTSRSTTQTTSQRGYTTSSISNSNSSARHARFADSDQAKHISIGQIRDLLDNKYDRFADQFDRYTSLEPNVEIEFDVSDTHATASYISIRCNTDEEVVISLHYENTAGGLTLTGLRDASQIRSAQFPHIRDVPPAPLSGIAPAHGVDIIALHYRGPFTGHGLYLSQKSDSPTEEMLQNLGYLLKDPCIIRLAVVRTASTAIHFPVQTVLNHYNRLLAADRERGAWQFEKFGGVIIAKRDEDEKQNKKKVPLTIPDRTLSARASFISSKEMLVVNGFGTRLLDEYEEAMEKKEFCNVACRVVAMPESNVKRVIVVYPGKIEDVSLGTTALVDFKDLPAPGKPAAQHPNMMRIDSAVDLPSKQTQSPNVQGPADLWKGEIIDNLPGVDAAWTCIAVKAPIIKGDKKQQKRPPGRPSRGVDRDGDTIMADGHGSDDEEDVIPHVDVTNKFFKGTRTFQELQKPSNMAEYLKSAKSFKVDILIPADSTMRRRHAIGFSRLESLIVEQIKKSPDHVSQRALSICGGRLDLLKRVNVFDGLSAHQIATAYENLNAKQSEGMLQVQNMLGDVGRLMGPPGTGKSHVIRHIIRPFSHLRLDQHASMPTKVDLSKIDPLIRTSDTWRAACPVLVTAPVNSVLDHLAVSIHRDLLKMKRNPIVIRCIARGVEKQYSLATKPQPLMQIQTAPRMRSADIIADTEEQMHIFSRKTNVTTDTPSSDGTIDIFPYTLNVHIYVAAGFPVPRKFAKHPYITTLLSSSLTSHFQQWSNYRSLVIRWRQTKPSGAFSADERKELNHSLEALTSYVLRHADVACLTLAHALDDTMTSNLSPRLLLIDEAAKAHPGETLPLMGVYPCPIVMVGDHKQLRPQIRSPVECNPYAPQLFRSEFERLERLGLPKTQFEVQHRAVQQVGAVTDLHYGNLQHFAGTMQREGRAKFERFVKETWGEEGSVVLLDLQGSKSLMPRGPSSVNPTALGAVGEVVRCLFSRQGREVYSVGEVAILTPYKAQNEEHKAGLKSLAKGFGRADVEDLFVGTFDAVQGREFPVVIVDLVKTGSIGFLEDEGRLNVGCSRAMFGWIIVADTEGLRAGARGAFLEKLFAHLKREGNAVI